MRRSKSWFEMVEEGAAMEYQRVGSKWKGGYKAHTKGKEEKKERENCETRISGRENRRGGNTKRDVGGIKRKWVIEWWSRALTY